MSGWMSMYKIEAMKHKEADIETFVRTSRNDDHMRVMSQAGGIQS